MRTVSDGGRGRSGEVEDSEKRVSSRTSAGGWDVAGGTSGERGSVIQ